MEHETLSELIERAMLQKFILDPNRLSIPSEQLPQGSFNDRLPRNVDPAADPGMADRGSDFVIRNFLNQLTAPFGQTALRPPPINANDVANFFPTKDTFGPVTRGLTSVVPTTAEIGL